MSPQWRGSEEVGCDIRKSQGGNMWPAVRTFPSAVQHQCLSFYESDCFQASVRSTQKPHFLSTAEVSLVAFQGFPSYALRPAGTHLLVCRLHPRPTRRHGGGGRGAGGCPHYLHSCRCSLGAAPMPVAPCTKPRRSRALRPDPHLRPGPAATHYHRLRAEREERRPVCAAGHDTSARGGGCRAPRGDTQAR